jgi:hypothetical protein
MEKDQSSGWRLESTGHRQFSTSKEVISVENYSISRRYRGNLKNKIGEVNASQL